jgi:hypothetical protein
MGDCQNQHLNTNRWKNEIKGAPERDGKISSWKKVEEYRLNMHN